MSFCVFFEIARRDRFRRLNDKFEPMIEEVVDASPRYPEQPRDGLPTRRVEGLAVAQRSLERVARHVLGVGAIPDPVRDVGVDASDQWFGILEWIDPHRQPLPVGGIRIPFRPTPATNSATSGLCGFSAST